MGNLVDRRLECDLERLAVLDEDLALGPHLAGLSAFHALGRFLGFLGLLSGFCLSDLCRRFHSFQILL